MDRSVVNAQTNKQWKYRLVLVDELAQWVVRNLKNKSPSWGGRGRDKKSSAEGRKSKAYQYVYEYLAVGKMEHPHETHDPLFTRGNYTDKSMLLQLNPGMYPRFIEQVSEKQRKLQLFRVEEEDTVEWEELEKTMTRATKDLLAGIRTDMYSRWQESDSEWVNQHMIGLVLRYKCMGAFSDNLHGSVPGAWTDVLGQDFVECFASPFNHKFELYYSIYDQDKVFGSKGNFFSMIDCVEQQGMLPDDGMYEINPPWNNQMYEKVNQVLKKTLANGRCIQAVIVGPNWRDTDWIPGLDKLLQLDPDGSAYKEHSLTGTGDMWYRNDATDSPFRQNTVYWIFSTTELPKDIPSKLGLPKPSGEGSVADATSEDTLFPFTLSLL